MLSILAPQAPDVVTSCPAWCAGHLPKDDGHVHLSVDQTVVLTADRERTEAYVSVEQVTQGVPAVRLQGAADAPMSPWDAMTLAAALQAAAFAALSDMTRTQGGAR